jgi:hypothetical protein
MDFGDKLLSPKSKSLQHMVSVQPSPFLFEFHLHERAAGLPEQVAGMEVVPIRRGRYELRTMYAVPRCAGLVFEYTRY